ncbi:MAG: geranylgeranylglycerol-phosphate geranylgeranyltransferase [Candidatus Micrarchaeota archaeon]|nr:geranylgeranylglycerol-phosphate geranylgeranyltransferase [Candidatus Micrarchaeota archaeon]
MKFRSALQAWWRLTRGEHALMTFFAVMFASHLVAKELDSFYFAALGPALITAGSFVLNDWFDYASDRANRRRDRPLVGGEIKRNSALTASIVLFAAGVALTLFVNAACFATAAIYSFFAIIYSPLLKKIPLAGNAFIASSMGVAFLYGNLAAAKPLQPLVLLWIAIAFVIGLAREFLITLRDVKGDRKTGALTLPMIIGPKATAIVSAFLAITAIGLSVLPLTVSVNVPYLVIVAVADAMFLLAAFKTLSGQGQQVLRQARELTLRGLIAGLVAFAALAVA